MGLTGVFIYGRVNKKEKKFISLGLGLLSVWVILIMKGFLLKYKNNFREEQESSNTKL